MEREWETLWLTWLIGYYSSPEKKITYWGEGKGCCCCLGYRNYAVPCRAIFFTWTILRIGLIAPGWFKEKDEFNQDDLKNRTNCTRMTWRKGWIAPGWYEEKDDLKNRMNCTRMIWRIGWIAPGWFEENNELHHDDLIKE